MALTPFSVLNSSWPVPVNRFGLGTVLHPLPSQCSMRVCTTKSAVVYSPTAQASLADTTATSLSELSCAPMFGLATTVNWQPVPVPEGDGVGAGEVVGDGDGAGCRLAVAVCAAPAGAATAVSATTVTDPANRPSTPANSRRRERTVSSMPAPYAHRSASNSYVVVKVPADDAGRYSMHASRPVMRRRISREHVDSCLRVYAWASGESLQLRFAPGVGLCHDLTHDLAPFAWVPA